MSSQKLAKAPLVEAILEIRWKLVEQSPGVAIDPKYKVLVGRLYDRLENEYSFHEPLPAASMPDEMLGYIVQHRFRTAENQWPLIQVGPGLATLNETANYTWKDFEPRCHQLLKALFAAYPDATHSLIITRLQLRYIDAIPFEFSKGNVFDFMSENLKIKLSFPQALFDNAPIKPTPIGFNSIFSFPTTKPRGVILLRFAPGVQNDRQALIWETVVESDDSTLLAMPEGFENWLNDAHMLIHNLFFKLIEGKLKESFE